MRGAVLALVVGTAPVAALAADERLLESADLYFQCAAFYKGALDADALPKGRRRAEILKSIDTATEVATGLGITAREGPRRMTLDELETTKRRVAVKADYFASEFRKDGRSARQWIAETFALCDARMKNIGERRPQG
ncbi:MAG: hypothetical protein ACK4RZ_13105 [Paracoccaceae bacterium]